MRLPSSLPATVCVAVIFGAPGLVGEEPVSELAPPASVAPANSPTAAGVLEELTRLRQEVGQNIFAGSVLDGDDTTATFENSLRAELGLPAQKESEPAKHVIRGASSSPSQTSRVVTSIRSETARLDQLAQELEQSREYEHADRLRAIAQRLRLAARELDQAAPR